MKKLLCVLISVLLTVPVVPVCGVNVYGSRENGEMMIALTFDDGPHPRVTPKILDILSEYGVKATFFEVGENVGYYPEVTKRVLSEGHEIGNHTFTHPHLKNVNEAVLEKEVKQCEDKLFEVAGYKPALFRPPEGVVDGDVRTMADVCDYSVILWDIDTRDWAGTSEDAIVENVLDNVSSGDIILMHDYISKKCNTVGALERIIPVLLGRGYKFVTVSELIK